MTNSNIILGGKISIIKRHPKIKRKCLNCDKEFWVWRARVKINKGRFCSIRCGKLGKFNKFWNGGKRKSQGYIHIYKPDHPFSTKKGYVSEHRLVMEEYIGRYLTKKEVIHHKNRIRNDNRIENLQLMESQSAHYSEHMIGNKIWLGRKHNPKTIVKMKEAWKRRKYA